jgi:DNA-binding CsgD family transcriptional regulator
MNKWKRLIQKLQETYSLLFQILIFVADKHGEALTEVVDCRHNMRADILNHQSLKAEVKLYLQQKSKKIVNPMLIDIPSENVEPFSFMVIPITIENEIGSYLIAGPVKHEMEVRMLMKEFQSLAELTSELLHSQTKERLETELNQLKDTWARADSDREAISSTLEIILNVSKDIDFVGYASFTEDHSFQIIQCIGETTSKLKYTNFYPGEGFLGQAVAEGQNKMWSDIESNPRSSFFLKKGIKVRHLFCYPIMIEGEGCGLIFLASSNSFPLKKEIFGFGEKVSHFVCLHLQNQFLKEAHLHQKTMTDSLTEVCQTIQHIKDKKKLYLALIDMSRNITQSLESSVIPLEEELQWDNGMVTRGAHREIQSNFVKDIVSRYSGKKRTSTQQEVYELGNGIVNVETPVRFQQKVYGVLCVSFPHVGEFHRYRHFLKILADIGGLALSNFEEGTKRSLPPREKRVFPKEAMFSQGVGPISHQKDITGDNLQDMQQIIKTLPITQREQEVLTLILKGFNNQEIANSLCISIHTVKNHLTNIFQKLGVSDRAQAMAMVYSVVYEQANIEDY